MQKQTTARRGAAFGMAALLLAAGGAGARAPHKGHALSGAGAKTTMTLSGQIGGTWRQTPTPPDAGGAYELSGNGAVAPLGTMQAVGSLHAPGMILNGRTTGTVTLTGANGTLTLALTGPAHPDFAATPFAYTVTGGTGAYAGAHSSGTAQLSMTPQRRPATVPGQRTPHYIIAAMFGLTFGSAPSAHR